VRRVEGFDHLHAGAAILGDLINVGSFHQPHADVGVPEAIGRSAIAIAVELQLQVFQNHVNLVSRGLTENLIRTLMEMSA
jgi:hypothetical protein